MQGDRYSHGKKNRYTSYFVILAIVKLRRRSKRSKHRRYVLQQWLQTERSYHTDLTLAVNHIKAPLLKQHLIDNQGARVLCSDFEQMVALSVEMVNTITIVEKQKNMSRIIIGPELIKFGSFYKLTSEYFSNRLKSEKLLKKLYEEHHGQMKGIESRFQQAAKMADSKKEHMTITGCLEQPQYRMFKYGLLLKEYIRKMPKWHQDYQAIEQAMVLFEQISLNNNDRMAKLQLAEKKVKLNQLAGKALDSQSQFVVQMTADSLYFPVKLYIFNNLIIVTKIQRILSFQEERKYLNIYLNEFSYVMEKPDGKYYKNGLIICGLYEALHLFTGEPGSRLEIVKTLQTVIGRLQESAVAKRKKSRFAETNKLSFALNIGRQTVFAPQIRAEVLHTEVRPLGKFTNDTVYLTRFASPLWNQDLALVDLSEIKPPIGPWQLVEVHLSRVMELYETLCEQYKNIQFPKVDPVTKEMNAWTEGKKKTIMYEQRGFLFQQFFNFILRNPTVMKNPMQIIHKHKIIPTLWDYLIKKNDYLACRTDQSKKDPNYFYGGNHCHLCEASLKASLQDLQKYRLESLQKVNRQHCFNAYCLFRIRMISLPLKPFNTLERILMRQLVETGRMDYAMLPSDQLNKRYQEVTVMTCGESLQHLVVIDYRSKVGEIMFDLGFFFGMSDALDCRLILRYQGKERLLDQDEVLFDLITKYNFPVTQREATDRQSRESYNVTTIKKQQGLFSFLSDVFSSKVDSYLSFRKIIYLSKEIQIQAIMNSSKRGKYVTDELFARLGRGEIPLMADDYAEASTLWLVLNHSTMIKNSPISHILKLVEDKLVHPKNRAVLSDKMFLKVFGSSIDNIKKIVHVLSQKERLNTYRRTIRVFYRSIRTYTYTTPFTLHTLPATLIMDNHGLMAEECYLGINFKQFMVFRNQESATPAVKLSLQDVKITCSTFSLFINYTPEVGSSAMESQLLQGPRQTLLRFDGRLIYHFRYLVEFYQSLRRTFSNHFF